MGLRSSLPSPPERAGSGGYVSPCSALSPLSAPPPPSPSHRLPARAASRLRPRRCSRSRLRRSRLRLLLRFRPRHDLRRRLRRRHPRLLAMRRCMGIWLVGLLF